MVKLFSIKQKYSERIFRKEKLVEFRRQNVNVHKNETCLVYTTSPVKRLTGYFVVREKVRLPITKLWGRTKKYAGITKKEFLRYFEGCKEGTAIIFKVVQRFVKALTLLEIKSRIKTFRPPQSYYNIDKSFIIQLNQLFAIHKTPLFLL